MLNIKWEDQAIAHCVEHNIQSLYIVPINRRVCCSTYGDFQVVSKITKAQSNNLDFTTYSFNFQNVQLSLHIVDKLTEKNQDITIALGKGLFGVQLYIKGLTYDFIEKYDNEVVANFKDK